MPIIALMAFVIFLMVLDGLGFFAFVGYVFKNFVIPGIVLAVIAWVVYQLYKSAEKSREERERWNRAREEEKRRLAEKRAAENRRIENEIRSLEGSARQIVSLAEPMMAEIPERLRTSEKCLSDAIKRFKSRCFNPFWDSIGEAVDELNGFHHAVARLDDLRNQYAAALYRLMKAGGNVGEMPSFPVSRLVVPYVRDAERTAERIDTLSERAHKDFEFASIYANWRTNASIIKGFSSLSAAMRHIENQLSNLNFSVIEGLETVRDAIDENTRAIREGASMMSDAMDRNAEQSRMQMSDVVTRLEKEFGEGNSAMAREIRGKLDTGTKQQEEMIRLLDNIQRGREDLPGLMDFEKAARTRPSGAGRGH